MGKRSKGNEQGEKGKAYNSCQLRVKKVYFSNNVKGCGIKILLVKYNRKRKPEELESRFFKKY